MNHKSSRALALLIIVTIFIAGSALTYSRIYGAEEVLGAKTASLSETVHGWWLSLVKFFKIKQTFRKIGWIKTTTSGFFTALETQDLTYDYNDDQKVTSEDYKLMINEINQRLQAKKPETMVSEPASGDGEGGIAAEESGGANEHLSLPSVSGFNSDAFSGSASVSYPIGLPSSAGGVAPSLAVAYSSSTVDDMWVGTETRWRNDAEHPYQKHAGELGLGWSLAGGGTITRDINETEDDPNDDKFYLSFGGGSAKLIPADGEENPGDFDDLGDNCDGIGTSIKEYKTIPDLFIKVERWGTKQGGHIRYHWLVIDGSGTKHLFGTTPMEYPDWTRNDQGQEQGFEVVPLGLCQADFYRLDPSRSWMWQNGHTRQLETKWNLVKSTNIYGIEVNYSWDWSLGDSYAWTSEGATCAGDSRCDAAYCSEDNSAKCSTKKCKDGSNKNCRQACCSNYQYPSSEFLTKVSWGKRTDPPIAAMHEVEIVREDRLDTQTHVGSLSDMNGQPLQRYIYPQRVKKILVKTRDPNTNSFQTVGGYRFEYDYAWNPDKHNDDGDGIPEDGEIVSGQVIHSMLKNITSYAGDPDGSPTPEKLPAYSFTYGQLNAFTSPDNDTQTTTENDYYLVAADNGFNGKVEFRYYDADSDGTGDALKIQLCNREKGDNCKFDRTYNYQRHRIAAKITHDGMGNWTKEQYDYQDENGNASTYGKAAVKKYVQYPSSECNHGSSVCTSGDCAWVSENASWCWKPGTCNQYPCNWNEDYRRYYTADNCPKSAVECRCECGITEQKPATDFEFLGYPQVTTIVYEKNSESVKAAQTRTNFYQAMETDSCFKPNPLKGTPLRTETYNVSIDPPSVHSYSVSVTNIRFGREGAYTYKKDTELNAYCPDYDYDKTVYVIQPQESRSAVGSGANMVCTKTGVYDYDGWNNPGKSVAYGAANCPGTVPNKDWWDKDNSDNKYTFTKYMTGDYNNTSYYFTPRPYETWTSNSNDPACNPGGCTKYGHTQTFFEDNTLGKISGYGRTTKTQTLKGEDGSVATWSTVAYEDAENRPWNAKSSTDALNHTTTTTYDSIYHMFPKTVTNAKGQTSTTVYDFEQPSNNERYGLRGLPISVTDPNNATTNSCYDNFGRATKVFLPGNNFTTCSSIDFNQNTAYYYYNDEDVGGLNNCTLANHCHSDLGKQIGGVWIPKMMVGQTTKYGFTAEAVGKLTLSHTFYNGLGQTVQTHSGFVDGDYGNINYYGIPVSDCSTNPCTTTYKDFWSSQTYNSLGQPDQVSQPWTAGPYMYSSANPVSSYDRTGFNNVAKTTYQYDGLGRATEVIYPDGKSEKTGYEVDGNPLVTDAKDRNCAVDGGYACTIKRTFANIWGQTTKVEEIEHNSADPNFPDKITTKYEYHPVLGSLTKTIDTHGTTVNIVQYNSLGQKMAMWDKDMSPAMEGDVNAWMYEYDVLGNLIFQKDPKNTAVNPSQKIKLEYDNLNRLTKKQLVRSSDNQVIRTMLEYVYDNENKSCGDGIANAVGRKCKYVSYNDNNQEIETVLYSYDNRGQLTKQIQNFKNLPHSDITNQDFVTEYTKYDEGGRNLTMKYPGFVLGSSTVQSETISTKYNRPYLEKISGTYDGGVTNQIYASAAIYNEYGQMLQFKSGNEVFNDYTYDSDTQRLNSLKVDHDGWGTQQMNLSYQYDDAGNITAIADNSGKAQGDDFYLGQNFTYDPLYRLTSASNAYAASYAYDSIGNITSKKEGDTNPTMTYTHGGDGFYHRPSKTTVNGVNTNYTYDSVGNMITSGQYTYQYDAENRLMKVIEPVSPTPTPTVLPTATPTMMVTPTATKTPTPTPNIPTPTATKTPTPVPSVLTPTPPIPTATKTPTPKPTSTVRPSPTASPYNGYKCDPKTKKCSRVKNCTLDGYTCVSSCILCGTTASPTPTSGPLGMAQSETVILGEKTIALNPGMNNIDWTAEYPKLSVSEVARSLGTKVNLITREEGGYRYIYIPGFGGQDFDLKAGNTYYIYSLETESFDWQLPEGSRQAEIKLQEPQNTGETKFIYDGEGQRISKTDSAGNTTYYISPLLEIGINADGTKFYRINYFFGGKFVAVRNGP